MTAAHGGVTDDVVRYILDSGTGLGAEMTSDRLAGLVGQAGGLGGVASARMMMAQLGASDPALRQACARAIEACDGWEALLAELLADVEADAAVDVAAKVLATKRPDHPLARLTGPLAAIPAFDLNGRGTRLRMPSTPLPTAWHDAILVGVDRPAHDTARVAALSDGGEWLSVEIDGLHDWIEPHRAVCPGCLLVVV